MWSTHYSCYILIKLEFFKDNFLTYSYKNFMKICPLGAKLFHPDGERIDIAKQTIAYSNLCLKSHQTDMLHTLCRVWNLRKRKLCSGTAKVSRFVLQFRSHLLSVYNDLFSPTISLVNNRIKAIRAELSCTLQSLVHSTAELSVGSTNWTSFDCCYYKSRCLITGTVINMWSVVKRRGAVSSLTPQCNSKP
jgi:hypothetical protein